MSKKEIKIEWKKEIEQVIGDCKKKITKKCSMLTGLYTKNLSTELSEFETIFNRRRYQIENRVQLKACISEIYQQYLRTDQDVDKKIQIKKDTEKMINKSQKILNEMNETYQVEITTASDARAQLAKQDSDYSDYQQKYTDIQKIYQKLTAEKKYMNLLRTQNKENQENNEIKTVLNKMSNIICKINAIDPDALNKYDKLINDALSTQNYTKMKLIKEQLDLVFQDLDDPQYDPLESQVNKELTEEKNCSNYAENFVNEKLQKLHEKKKIIKRELEKLNYRVIESVDNIQEEGYFVSFNENSPTLIKYISNESAKNNETEDNLKKSQFCKDTKNISKEHGIYLNIISDVPELEYRVIKTKCHKKYSNIIQKNQYQYKSI